MAENREEATDPGGYPPPVGFGNDGSSDAERHNAEVAEPVEADAYVDASPGAATELTSDTGRPLGGKTTDAD